MTINPSSSHGHLLHPGNWQGIPSTYSRLAKTILGQIHSYPWQVIIFMVVLWSCVPAEESVEGLCMVFLPGRYGINMQRQRFPPPSLFTISTRDGTQSPKVKEYVYIFHQVSSSSYQSIDLQKKGNLSQEILARGKFSSKVSLNCSVFGRFRRIPQLG